MADEKLTHVPLTGNAAVSSIMNNLKDLTYCSFTTLKHGRMIEFSLLNRNLTGLCFSTRPIDVGERMEIGVLLVDVVTHRQENVTLVELPEVFKGPLQVEKLVMRISGFRIESGMVFSANNNSEIVLVAGAYPYTIEAKTTPNISLVEGFQPEYNISEYLREALQERLE